jgi:hypothetical protein
MHRVELPGSVQSPRCFRRHSTLEVTRVMEDEIADHSLELAELLQLQIME